MAIQVLRGLMELSIKGSFNKSEKVQVNLYSHMLAKTIQDYESIHYPRGKVTARDMLEYLMELKGLKQVDLAEELGGQPVVSAILRGKRKLNKKQIQKLAKRFGVSVETFFDQD